MTLPHREERLLLRVDQALRRSDPDLASRLSLFALLNAAEAMPARERLRPRPSWAWRVLLWPAAAVAFLVAALVFLVVFAAGGGTTAAMACGAAPVSVVFGAGAGKLPARSGPRFAAEGKAGPWSTRISARPRARLRA
jgi:hypothetical protein